MTKIDGRIVFWAAVIFGLGLAMGRIFWEDPFVPPRPVTARGSAVDMLINRHGMPIGVEPVQDPKRPNAWLWQFEDGENYTVWQDFDGIVKAGRGRD